MMVPKDLILTGVEISNNPIGVGISSLLIGVGVNLQTGVETNNHQTGVETNNNSNNGDNPINQGNNLGDNSQISNGANSLLKVDGEIHLSHNSSNQTGELTNLPGGKMEIINSLHKCKA